MSDKLKLSTAQVAAYHKLAKVKSGTPKELGISLRTLNCLAIKGWAKSDEAGAFSLI